MTEQKPAGKSWESWIEQLIHEAREEGAFDDLEGAGKPVPNLGTEYDPDWWVKKLVQREGVSDLPPALELRRKIEKTLMALGTARDEAEVRRTLAALNAEIRKVNASVSSGPATSIAPFDVDDMVREWRRRR